MNNKKNWLQWFKERKVGKEQWLILVLVGILLMVIAMPTGNSTVKKKNEEKTEAKAALTDDYVENMERRLEHALEQVEGVGKTSVMITLSSSAEKIIEKDTETRTSSSSSGNDETSNTNDVSSQSVYSNLSDGEVPYVKQELSPEIEGVLVIAEGGANAVVKQNITEVVQALFGIETHKIRVMKHN